MKPPLPCGTDAAYHGHRRRGEPACSPCLDAHAAYGRQYQATVKYLRARRKAA